MKNRTWMHAYSIEKTRPPCHVDFGLNHLLILSRLFITIFPTFSNFFAFQSLKKKFADFGIWLEWTKFESWNEQFRVVVKWISKTWDFNKSMYTPASCVVLAIHFGLNKLFVSKDHCHFTVPIATQTPVVYVGRSYDGNSVIHNHNLIMNEHYFSYQSIIQHSMSPQSTYLQKINIRLVFSKRYIKQNKMARAQLSQLLKAYPKKID